MHCLGVPTSSPVVSKERESRTHPVGVVAALCIAATTFASVSKILNDAGFPLKEKIIHTTPKIEAPLEPFSKDYKNKKLEIQGSEKRIEKAVTFTVFCSVLGICNTMTVDANQLHRIALTSSELQNELQKVAQLISTDAEYLDIVHRRLQDRDFTYCLKIENSAEESPTDDLEKRAIENLAREFLRIQNEAFASAKKSQLISQEVRQ